MGQLSWQRLVLQLAIHIEISGSAIAKRLYAIKAVQASIREQGLEAKRSGFGTVETKPIVLVRLTSCHKMKFQKLLQKTFFTLLILRFP